jgi:predicted Fe-Mo cluster-binding NifX family protein
MKVCVPSFGPTLDSRVQPIFGRCEYFLLVDSDSMEFEVEPNQYASASEEAGIENAKMVAEKGATVVLTAQVGEKTRQALSDARVEVMEVKGRTVREVVEAFRKR